MATSLTEINGTGSNQILVPNADVKYNTNTEALLYQVLQALKTKFP